MSIDFRNTNTLWASVLVETLHRLGLKIAVICPGSRSAPLAIAFAQHPHIEAIPILDERSASFFALGAARQSHQPVALVCTSGTAGANFYPAVIEAHESRVPLLVLTADRPPELRDCNAGQTINQQRLYGEFSHWYHELALPNLDLERLAYLRQTVVQACDRTVYPVSGPVHLNLPFRDPLIPIPQAAAQALAAAFDPAAFFSLIQRQRSVALPNPSPLTQQAPPSSAEPTKVSQPWETAFKLGRPSTLTVTEMRSLASLTGIIVAGPAQPQFPQRYCEAIAHLSKTLGFPVLAEALSPLRNYHDLNPYLISTYDLMLRDRDLAAKLAPEVVIRVGEMPTSKELRAWLTQTQPLQWIVDEGDRNLDPLHLRTTHLRCTAEEFAQSFQLAPNPPTPYLQLWCDMEFQVRHYIDRAMAEADSLVEGKVAWMLSQYLPEKTPLFIANSTPIRDVEWFWQPGNAHIQPFFNRGANGIDGTLSTALGMAHHNLPSVLLTGDLALLHDTNGFLIRKYFQGHLTIVLVNNDGGGIFELLPISKFDPPFEEFFATPQSIDFAQLCATYGVDHTLVQTREQLEKHLHVLPESGIRVLEVRCDRKLNAQWLHQKLNGWMAK